MSFGRRGFLRSLAAGGAACLAGCDAALAPFDAALDGGAPCPTLDPPRPPPALDYPSADYFGTLAADLDAAGIGTPMVFLDMDRVDANIDAIASAIPSPLSWRIVEKSLPSLDLLGYVSARSGSDKLLVLHLPFLPTLLGALPDAEVLMGKTHLTSAVAAFFDGLPAGTELAAIARRTVFLADGRSRLDELIALAGRLGVRLRIAIEIDIGLRRSGLEDPSELPPLLSAFLGSSAVELAGLLGYDGHVAFAPGGARAVDAAWSSATDAFQSFVDVLSEPEFASLAALPDLIFHSGGSSTHPMYTSGTPVNDVAAGGAVVRPGAYPDHVISALRPAIFIATPVLRQVPNPRLPFFTAEQSARLLEGRQGLTLYGGGWPAFFTHPADIQPAPLVSDPTDHVMVPNQGLVTAPAELAIGPGDWIFYHPRQADALFQFEAIHQVRAGRLHGDVMRPYPRRY